MRSKARKFNLKKSEMMNHVDALFYPTDDPGWVLMYASPKGRDHINGLFPKGHIEWGDPGEGFPPDWRAFSINVPDVVSAINTKLPLDVMPKNYTIDDCSQDQLAFLLAKGVQCDGGRAARVDYITKRKPQIEIYLPPASGD